MSKYESILEGITDEKVINRFKEMIAEWERRDQRDIEWEKSSLDALKKCNEGFLFVDNSFVSLLGHDFGPFDRTKYISPIVSEPYEITHEFRMKEYLEYSKERESRRSEMMQARILATEMTGVNFI